MSDEREIAALRAENLQLRERLAQRERDLDEARRSSECHGQRADTLEEVLRAVPDLFFQVARDGTILRCIIRPSDDFYMPPEEFMGKPMQDILPPHLGKQFVEALTKVNASGEAGKVEYELPMQGVPRWYEGRFIPIERGEVVVVVRDITEQRQDREALRLLNTELEARVEERTVALEAASEQRLALQRQVIDAQRASLHALSTPLVPIARRVVAVPLIGDIGPERAAQLLETILAGVQARGVAVVLLDVTGVPSLDAAAAEGVVRVSRAVALLGAELILTGIGPEVARMLVSMGAALGGLRTMSSLEQGIAHALGRVDLGATDVSRGERDRQRVGGRART
ncbi:PAS domain-containing protein [Chondromyces apiculatus]|uniref:STAS domain-containing protein n=1 Tax=Chondromyces apiculatus DSM 436 TaxID=1192034 RepID=A0A017TIN8_9BACT|nr:PAS domain-containing protein [Chondromyces apiculatus]EYF08767.1 Hypothetical protein CAP_2628 [Chondromyces apiculatus DSM 436]